MPEEVTNAHDNFMQSLNDCTNNENKKELYSQIIEEIKNISNDYGLNVVNIINTDNGDIAKSNCIRFSNEGNESIARISIGMERKRYSVLFKIVNPVKLDHLVFNFGTSKLNAKILNELPINNYKINGNVLDYIPDNVGNTGLIEFLKSYIERHLSIRDTTRNPEPISTSPNDGVASPYKWIENKIQKYLANEYGVNVEVDSNKVFEVIEMNAEIGGVNLPNNWQENIKERFADK